MASNSNIFALLLAGLDVNASAAEINKQLNSDQFKNSLDGLKTTLQLDENTFKALEDAMKNANTNAESLKKTLTEAADTFTRLQAEQQRTVTQKASGNALLSHAQEVLPGIDFTTIKKDIDPLTQEVQSLTLEWNKTGDAVYRVKVKIDDLNDSGYSMESIRMVETVRKEFKQYELDIAKTTKELEKLKIEESQRGQSADLTARVQEANLKLYDSYVKIDDVLKAAASSSNLTQKEFQDLGGLAETVFKDAEKQLQTFDTRLSESKGFKDAEAALSQYKKEYMELKGLANQEAVQGEKFSQGDKERLTYLQKNTAELTKTMSVYPELIKLADKFTKAQKPAVERDLGLKESKEATQVLKDLTKEYTALAKVQHDISMKGLKEGTEAETAALAKQRDVILGNVEGLRERLKTVQTTSGAQEIVTNGLIEVENEYAAKVEINTGKYIDAQRKKAEAIKAFAGESTGVIADIDLSTMGKDLDVTNPKFQKLAEQLYDSKAAVKDLKMENDGLGNSYLTMTVTQDTTADRLQHTKVRVHELTGAMSTLDAGTSQNVSRMMGFSEQLGHAVKKMAVWGVAAKLLHGSLQQLRKGMSFVSELDKDITQAAVVTGQQRAQVQGLADTYAKLGIEMGKTVGEISKVNTALLRQGLTIEESQGRLDTIMKLSAAGQISTEDSLHIVTAAVNAMKESHVTASDVMLRASNISASSVEQLGEAFTKTASSAYATGMNIQETTGILATMLEVTQEGPSQLGTSLKTILARFTRVNEETGEFNEELNKVQTAVESVGISFLNADGQIRNVYDILQDLSGVWQDLDKNQQAYIATTSAGVRMQNRFFALMNNFEKVQYITEQTGSAAGATERAFVTYLDSVEAASNRTKASLEQLWINVFNPNDIKMMYNLATGIIRLIDSLGGLNVVVGVTTIALATKFGVVTKLSKAIAEYIAFTILMKGTNGVLAGSTSALTAKITALSTSLGVSVAAMGAALGIIALLGFAVLGLARAYQKKKQAEQENIESLHELNKLHHEQLQNSEHDRARLKSLGDEYEELTKKIEASGLSADRALSSEEFERYMSVQKEMLGIYPELATGADRYGNELIVIKDGVEDILAQYDQFIDVTAENFQTRHKEMIGVILDDLDEYRTHLDGVVNEKPEVGGTWLTDSGREIEITERNIDKMLERWELRNDQIVASNQKMLKGVTDSLGIFITANTETLTDYQIKMLNTQAAIDGAMDHSENEASFTNYLNKIIEGSNRFSIIGERIGSASDEVDALNDRFDSGTIGITNYNNEMDSLIAKHSEILTATIKQLQLDIARKEMAGGTAEIERIALEALLEEHKKINEAKREQIELDESIAKQWDLQVKSLQENQTEITKITDLLGKLKDGYQFTAEGMEEVRAIAPDLINLLHDEVALRDALRERLQKQKDEHFKTYQDMMATSESFYNETIKLDTDFVNAMEDNNIVDYQNFKNLAEAKLAVEQKLIQELSKLWAKFYKVTEEGLVTLHGADGLIDHEFGMPGLEKGLEEIRAKKKQFDDLYLEFSSAGYKTLSGSLTKDSSGSGGSKETKAANDLLKQQQAEYKLIGDLLDAQIRKIKASNDKLEEGLVALRKQISEVDTSTIEGLQEKYRLTEELVVKEALYVESLKTEQDLAHEKANTLREMAPHLDTTKWFDANNEATEAYVLQLANADEGARALIEFLFGNLQKLKNLWGENADEVRRVVDVQKDLAKEMTKLIEQQDKLIEQQRELARANWIKEQNNALKDRRDRLQALQSIEEAIVSIIRKRGEEEKRVLDESHKAEMDSLEERHQERKKQYSEELDAFKKMIQDKIDALDEQYEEEDYLEQLDKEREEANELQRQIDVLSLDNSLTAKDKTIELRKKLADQNEKIAKMQQKKERDLLKKSLQDQLKDREQDVKDKETIADKTYDNEKKRLEEDYKINKEFLDRKYSDEQVYAEARESIMRGTVKTSKGMFVDIYDAYTDFEDKFGKGMGILGNIIKEDFLDQLDKAKQAVRDLEYLSRPRDDYGSDYQPRDDEWDYRDPPKDEPSPGDSGSSGGIYMSRQDFSQYRAYKMLYEAAQRSNDRATMDETHRLASAIRKKYGIVGDKYSFSDLQGKSHTDVGFKHGGKITETGTVIAPFHGRESSPEWIFNDSQLKSIVRDVTMSAIRVATPKIPNMAPQKGFTLQIDNFIKADNITKDSIPELKKIQVNAMQDLKNLLIKNGVRPSLI